MENETGIYSIVKYVNVSMNFLRDLLPVRLLVVLGCRMASQHGLRTSLLVIFDRVAA